MQWDAVLFDFEDTLVDLSRGGVRKGPLYFNGAPGAPPVRDRGGRPVMDAMLRLMEAGVPVAVITSSPEAAMGRWFQEQQLCLSRPMTVVGFHDTVLHRPSPHPLLEALHQLGLPASRRVLSVGDSAADIEAARRAGLTAATVRPLTPLGMSADLYLPTVDAFFDERLAYALAGDFESELAKTSLHGLHDAHEFLVGGRIRHRPSNRLTQLVDWSREGRWDESLVDLAETLVAHALGSQREDVLLTAVPPHRGQPDRLSALMARLRARTGWLASPLLRFQRDPGRQATRDRRARGEALEGCMEARGKHDLAGQTVLVVDDVRSSGATLREAARALLAGGAARVVGIALAQEENRLAELAQFGPLPSATQDEIASEATVAPEAPEASIVVADAAGEALDDDDEGEARRRVLGRVRVVSTGTRSDDGEAERVDTRRSPLPAGFARPAGVFVAPAVFGPAEAADLQALDEPSTHRTHEPRDVSDLAALPDTADLPAAPAHAEAVGDVVRDPEPTTPEAIKERYPRAYQRWRSDEDLRLTELHRGGEHDLFALADALGRQPAAVDSRIRRLGLDIDPALDEEPESEPAAASIVEPARDDEASAACDAAAPSDDPVAEDPAATCAPETESSDVDVVAPETPARDPAVEPAVLADVPSVAPLADASTVEAWRLDASRADREPEPTTPAEMRRRYPRAYQRWSADEDARLGELYRGGLALDALCDALGRQPSAVDSRIRRLGLDLPDAWAADGATRADDAAPSRPERAGGQAMLFGASAAASGVVAAAREHALDEQTVEAVVVAPLPESPAEIKLRYPRAYQRWSADEDARLRVLYREGLALDALCDALGRQPSAVDSRIRRLGLDLAPDDDASGQTADGAAVVQDALPLDDASPSSDAEAIATPVELPQGAIAAASDAETGDDKPAARAPEPTTPEGIKARYPRAFQRWEPAEDERLRALHGEGLALHALCDALGRQPSAVDSRIRRLGLDLDPDEDGQAEEG